MGDLLARTLKNLKSPSPDSVCLIQKSSSDPARDCLEREGRTA